MIEVTGHRTLTCHLKEEPLDNLLTMSRITWNKLKSTDYDYYAGNSNVDNDDTLLCFSARYSTIAADSNR